MTGVQTCALPISSGSWTPGSIRPFLSRALDCFGADRLMYGSDWPISVLSGGYERVWRGLGELVAELSEPDRENIMGRTALRFYGVDWPPSVGSASLSIE